MAGRQREILGQGKFLRLVRVDTWEFSERLGASGIVILIPVTPQGELVLVEQHRVPLGRAILELPAGLAGDKPGSEHEALELAACRELEEETGYRAGSLRKVAEGPGSAGSSNSVLTYFLCTDLEKVGEGGGDEHEDITVRLAPLQGIDAWLEAQAGRGMMVDPKIYAGLYFAQRFK